MGVGGDWTGLRAEGTDLAANVPHGHWVVVGRVGPEAAGVDTAELVHVVVDVSGACEQNTASSQEKPASAGGD